MEKSMDKTELQNMQEKLENFRPNEWEQIPDLDLYMDQVISYMPRQHIGLNSGEVLTSAMINNYIKVNLLPRANGKKYTREHIAYLTVICLLKQVVSVDQVGELLKTLELGAGDENKDNVKNFYEDYRKVLDEEFDKVSTILNFDEDEETLAKKALQFAISSYANKLACQEIINELAKKRR